MAQVYEYRCRECGRVELSTERGDSIGECADPTSNAPFHCPGELRRVFAVSLHRPMQEHFNHAVGKPISDMRQFRDELARKSDLASQHTGIEHRYVPVDMSDTKTLGVDGRGIDESNRVRSRKGEQLLPDIS